MSKIIKIVLFTVLLLIICLLLSPLISLIMPEKLTNRTYFRMAYQLIADRETQGSLTEAEKAERLFKYVVNHEFPQGTPYKCKPFESLVFGEAYCDFQARTLNSLLGAIGIPSRYAMLFDDQGISRHTVNEVFLNGKWCVFDITMNIIFRGAERDFVSLEDISAATSIIQDQEKMLVLKDYYPQHCERSLSWYKSMFPMPQVPERSTPVIYQSHLVDWIVDAYYKIFKRNLFYAYQDLYLKIKKTDQPEDFRLFFSGRNYHLGYRLKKAERKYIELLEKFPESEYADDALFFIGMLYFDEGDYGQAIDYLTRVSAGESSQWGAPVYYYLGRSYGLLGDTAESLKAYRSMAVIYQLTPETLKLIQYAEYN